MSYDTIIIPLRRGLDIASYRYRRQWLRAIGFVRTLKYKGPFSIDYRERESHARGMYLTQDTSRTRTVRVKQEEEAKLRIIAREK